MSCGEHTAPYTVSAQRNFVSRKGTAEQIHATNITAVAVKIWANDVAWAACRREVG
jgi:hypothetical protein